MGYNRHVPWPVPPYIRIVNPQNIIFHPDDMQNFHTSANYFQATGGKIIIGKGSMLAVGTGIITANHDPNNVTQSALGKDYFGVELHNRYD